MLFHVKWEGWPDLTWEPKESFSDPSVVKDYLEQHASSRIKALPAADKPRAGIKQYFSTTVAPAAKAKAPAIPPAAEVGSRQADSSESDEDSYEIENIRAHHLSDPRSVLAAPEHDPSNYYTRHNRKGHASAFGRGAAGRL